MGESYPSSDDHHHHKETSKELAHTLHHRHTSASADYHDNYGEAGMEHEPQYDHKHHREEEEHHHHSMTVYTKVQSEGNNHKGTDRPQQRGASSPHQD